FANAGMQKAIKQFPGLSGKPIQDPQIDTHGIQDLTEAAQAGYGLIIDLDFGTLDNLNQVAAKFPNTSFVFVDGVAKGSNVTNAVFNVQNSSYLCGMVAAMAVDNPAVNKTGKKIIGAVGGAKSPGIDQFLAGYQQGAQAVDPKIKVLMAYANNFADPTIGAELANAMFDQGALVVYQVAGVTGLGVIKAASQRGLYAIGVDSDQDGLAPGHVLTSSIKRTDTAVYDVISDYAQGKLPGGQTVYYDLPNGVGITNMQYTKSLFTAADLAKLQKTESDIESGALKVWNVPTQGYPPWFDKGTS
ncbi:MAG: BMP family lipoprotein, partial [Streptosporangiaceae bacterium]